MTKPTNNPTAPAQEAVTTTLNPEAFNQGTVDARFTAEDLQKARTEEKDKLYQRLEQEAAARKAMEDQVQALLAAQQERERLEQEALARAEAEAAKAAEENLSARDLLQKREAELNARVAEVEQTFAEKIEQMQREREIERATLEKDRSLAELQAYATRRVTEEQDSIAPELRDFITGNTPEEVEASINLVKEKSARIAEQVQAQLQSARATRGVSPTGYGAGSYEMESGQRQVTAEDIKNMSHQEYAEYRQKIGLGNPNGNRGMFS